ncbi:glycosyltransferase family 61 protein [Hymenobacter sp. BRD128]|uniref:glycosyltransferase family 61 protein n=1 Tax=Hymenobacter sp. BRD128 TaxID=2675878 RepID=UPI0015648B59|nr:glycosyltransferase family 61 protein [Hymenobacter sp. BRD128]QKG55505.1 glycosyltransferase family 61 protein [Hymenobacter sp. BRD128]
MIIWLKNHWLLADGAIFRQLRVVPDSMVLTEHRRIWLHNWKGLLQIWLRFAKKRLPAGKPYVRVHTSYRGYYHWLLESIPKLLEAQRTIPAFTLLLPASYTDAFYTDTLRLLQLTAVERLQPQTMYRVPELALPLLPEAQGNYSAQTMREVKAVLLAAAGVGQEAPASPTRLYISRRKAPRRKVLNELEVEQLLSRYGFQCVCFEDFAFEDQLRLCASANVLVSMHGAGLSNMIFMPERATVVEFRKYDDGHNYFFTRLGEVLGYQYHLLYCPAADEQQSVQDADLYVDIAALDTVLQQLPA